MYGGVPSEPQLYTASDQSRLKMEQASLLAFATHDEYTIHDTVVTRRELAASLSSERVEVDRQYIPICPTPTASASIASSLASIRAEMDTLMLRCAMSPAIREQQDELNIITTPSGKMLVGRFGSFIGQLLQIWRRKLARGQADEIRDSDVFITNDAYEVEGAVSLLNDVIMLLPIFFERELVDCSTVTHLNN